MRSDCFIFIRSCGVPKKYQQFIWAKTRLYHHLKPAERLEIDEIIAETCGPYDDAMRRLLIDGAPIRLTAMDCYVSVRTLRYRQRDFYRAFYKKIKGQD